MDFNTARSLDNCIAHATLESTADDLLGLTRYLYTKAEEVKLLARQARQTVRQPGSQRPQW